MTTPTSPNTSRPEHSKISLTAGILYLLTFVSIPTLALYAPAKSPVYIAVSSGSDTGILTGALLEVIVALSAIGSAVALYLVLKKQNEGLALGLVAARVLEAAGIFIGVACMLTIVSLHQPGAGAASQDAASLLAALYDRIFLQTQSFMPAINDMLLGYLFLRSGLIPRGLAMIGLIGGPILLVGYLAMLFGAAHQGGTVAGLTALPVAAFEFSLGVYLVAKGFRPKVVAALEAK
jgi:hypothetical protein